MINVAVIGAHGKMGNITTATVNAADNLNLVASLGRGDSLSEMIDSIKPDVVVDFTLPDCVFANAQCIIEHGAHPIIGTSGLTLPQIDTLTQACAEKGIGGLIVPNFSIGAILMMQFAEKAARLLPQAEIIEMHHEQKVDAPSGTARRTAEMLAPYQQESHQQQDTFHYQGVPIHSVRLPGLFAHQAVVFTGLGETLTIKHDATDRASMMKGIQLACEHVSQLSTCHYGLEHLLNQL